MATQDNSFPGAPTGNPYLDSLIWGCRWTGGPIAYSFGSGSIPDISGVTVYDWTQAEMDQFRAAVAMYESIANIDFVEVNSFGASDIVWWKLDSRGMVDIGASATTLGLHDVPDGQFDPAYGFFNKSDSSWSNLTQGGFGFITIIHELGHGLGLAHPHDGGSEGDATTFPGVPSGSSGSLGTDQLNQGIWTTMTYNDGWNKAPGVGLSYGYQGTPMAFDIAALQAIYGANTTFRTGNDVYFLPTVNAPGTFWSCIWDAGGVDEISGAGATLACKIDLNDAPLTGPNAGGFVSWVSGGLIRGGFTIANGVVIENATGGSGNDILTGNEFANVLKGGAGNDSLDGGLGVDQLIGDFGNDTYVVNDVGDIITESAKGGTDTVQTSLDGYVLDSEVEALVLLGNGDIDGSGNALANTLTGNSGVNRLDGAAGNDTMAGGLGNDTYAIDAVGDVVTELANAGSDTVESEVNYTLGANLENLVLIGAALVATGNTLANELIGNSLNNTLDGKSGADKMTGGLGDDIYFVDSTGDDVIETGSGSDEVRSAISLTKTFAGVERYTFIGTVGVNFAASSSDEIITGAAGADTLDGGGGDDTVRGGTGNDIYVVDSAGDVTDEAGGTGIDLVKSGVSRTLDAGLENLTLTGSSAIDGSGNALANAITGNIAVNKLVGLDGNDTLIGDAGADTLDGGVGSDRMAGGTDDDVYVVDLVTDVVTELAGGGKDTIKSSVTLTLGLEVENLELQGTGHLNGTGNTLANLLVGNSGNNSLDGKTGVDTMQGGLGDDTYFVDDAKDVVDETGGGGNDTVKASVSVDSDLAAQIETLVLMGTAVIGMGNASNNAMIGTTSGNLLNGRDGNDSLSGGAGNDTLAGEDGDDTMDGGAGIDEFNIFKSAGNDLYIVDNIGDKIPPTIDLGTDTVQSFVTWTLGSGQENLTLVGAGAINGTGNENANVIIGNAAANVLNGMAGVDEMAGGGGNDTYVVDAFNEKITEAAGQGTDLVRSTAFFTLPDNVENLNLEGTDHISGTGNALKNVISGNTGNNTLNGEGDNDTLNGGDGNDSLDGGIGSDSMAGGNGDDRYVVDAAGDLVTESSATGGHDTVESSQSYTLGANVENLELTGDKGINGTGNTLDNLLIGNFKDNVLDGKAGADTMQGGQGNDTYVIDNLKDRAEDTSGVDTVVTPFTTDLGATTDPLIGAFENLTFTGTSAVDGVGTDDFNVIVGNSGANKLFGLGLNDTLSGGLGNDTLDGGADDDSLDGGTGADVMEGGLGNDTFTVDSAMDKVTDAGGLGDTIRSTITCSLAALASIENLALLGAVAINGTGNGADNFLTGNDGANILDGGLGNDTMQGGKGNDTFKVDAAGDIVLDVANGGIDTVLSDVGYALADPNVENLTLTALAGVALAQGNGLANKITGNDFNNQLLGEAGADTLVGGKGNDTYFVDDVKDIVTELAGPDIDNVQSKATTYTLSANIENLTLDSGAGNISGIGNTQNNNITGNEGDNSLAGSSGDDQLLGNAGHDTLDGGAGNDTLEGGEDDDLYIVDSAGDKISEIGTTAGDELKTTQVLPGIVTGIEHYTFTGSVAVNFHGDANANRITGTALADTLDGGDNADTLTGGVGADSLVGNADNDTYVVDNVGDRLSDSSGIDTVKSSVSFDLTDDTGSASGTVFGTFENLVLTGTGVITGTGNGLGNQITGNDAANVLTGGGGDDTIDGSLGNDTFRYTSKLDGHDIINNFDGNAVGGQDVLNLDALFDSLSIVAASRAGRVSITDNGTNVDIRVDADGSTGNGFELFIATINTTDDIAVGSDIVVGT